jgi:hypothetical protein
LSPSSPTPGTTNSGDADHLSPRRQARRVPGEPLNLLASSPCSIASCSMLNIAVPWPPPRYLAAGHAPMTYTGRRRYQIAHRVAPRRTHLAPHPGEFRIAGGDLIWPPASSLLATVAILTWSKPRGG